MAIVAVVGAGSLGGALTHKLASRDRFGQVRLIDPSGTVAAGKAADIQQAGAVECFSTRVTAHGTYDAAGDADVIVLTGPAETADAEWSEEEGLDVLDQLLRFNRRAMVICAGASHRRLVRRTVSDLGVARLRSIGSAPSAFQAALQAILAVELRCSALEVSLAVMGIPPKYAVVPWSSATVRGLGLTEILDPLRQAHLQAKLPQIWPPGPYALASAAARVCEAAVDGTGLRAMSCYVVLDGEMNVSGPSLALMVELSTSGITRILDPALSVIERLQLETALNEGFLETQG